MFRIRIKESLQLVCLQTCLPQHRKYNNRYRINTNRARGGRSEVGRRLEKNYYDAFHNYPSI